MLCVIVSRHQLRHYDTVFVSNTAIYIYKVSQCRRTLLACNCPTTTHWLAIWSKLSERLTTSRHEIDAHSQCCPNYYYLLLANVRVVVMLHDSFYFYIMVVVLSFCRRVFLCRPPPPSPLAIASKALLLIIEIKSELKIIVKNCNSLQLSDSLSEAWVHCLSCFRMPFFCPRM